MMRQLPEEHPSIYKELMEGNCVVKTSAGLFNAVAPDMKLKQSIQRPRRVQVVSLVKRNRKLLRLNRN